MVSDVTAQQKEVPDLSPSLGQTVFSLSLCEVLLGTPGSFKDIMRVVVQHQ